MSPITREPFGVELPPSRIEPKLSAFDAAMIVVSLVIGIGIFRTPALVATQTSSPALFLAAWALGGVVSLAGALTFAEIGARFPRAGGYYKVAAVAWSPAFAFMLNWAQAIMQGVGATGVAIIGSEYLLRLASHGSALPNHAVAFTASALLLILLGLNFLGVRTGARTQNLLSILKIGMIFGLAVAAFLLVRHGPSTEAIPAPATGASAFLSALVAVFYTYGGYQCTMNIAGDVRDARRNLPRAVVLGTAIVTGLYLLINAAYIHGLGLMGTRNEALVAAGLARACFGMRGETVVSLLIFFSAAGFINATLMQVPRSYLAMAEDGAFPRVFLRVHPRTQVQDFGLAFLGFTSLLAVPFLGSFDKLVQYVMFTDSLMVAVVAAAIFILRRRGLGDDSSFRVPGYPLVPALFVACSVAIALHIVFTATRLALAGTAVLVLGGIIYRILHRSGSP
jgi:APA family basic amino acid/polyamine antiporter